MIERRSWLDVKVVPARSSIDGEGLFAAERIMVGEPLAIMGGVLMTDAEFASHVDQVASYSAVAIGEDCHLVQDPDDPSARGNHSCDPNAWLEDEVTIVARRDIAAWEAVTTDYATMTVDPNWAMICRCGSSQCRGTIRGNDWRLPGLQARYADHLSPFIAQRVSSAPEG